ncbi:hypothetical protein E2C01_098244 [Portunus trituberculatus]|uniref:Uncharacterized protein n=1 Tax=Portunus trituberculatus TaxID=210409 RepID=A0A5B7KBM6_PORTR|nr:hypothetical protein [Portunus trituberculatus]
MFYAQTILIYCLSICNATTTTTTTTTTTITTTTTTTNNNNKNSNAQFNTKSCTFIGSSCPKPQHPPVTSHLTFPDLASSHP